MGSAGLVSLDEYRKTRYRPDRDFIAGELRARHMGERPHAILHAYFTWKLGQFERVSGVQVVSSLRVQVRPDRIRVPDVSLIPQTLARQRIVTAPPVLCVEVFSSYETLADIHERAVDYARMGVEDIWAVDPFRRQGFVFRDGELARSANEVLRVKGTPIRVSLTSAFGRLAC